MDEIFRVLKPNGGAIVMLYKRYSLRYIAAITTYLRGKKYLKMSLNQYLRYTYDHNLNGVPTPYTQWVTAGEIKRAFRQYSRTGITVHKVNQLPLTIFNLLTIPKHPIAQKLVQKLGSDYYIRATK